MDDIETTYNGVVERFERTLTEQFPGITWILARYKEMVTKGYTQVGANAKQLITGILVTATDEHARSSQRFVPTDLISGAMGDPSLHGLLFMVGDQLAQQIDRDNPK